jgi:transcriptional regulator with XRE-family HTH domain
LGISSSAIRHWESGTKFPSAENFAEFAAVTGADTTWLTTSFTEEQLKLAASLLNQPRPVPFLQFEQLDVLANADGPQAWPDAPAVFPSFPCSEQAFAIKIFDHRNSPEFEAGDIIIVDPPVEPTHGDWIVACVGPVRSPMFGRFVLGGLDAKVEQTTDEIVAMAKRAVERRFDWLVSELGEETAKEYAAQLIDEVEADPGDFAPRQIGGLAPLRGEPLPLRTLDIILGVMVEHRHPRRTVSHR